MGGGPLRGFVRMCHPGIRPTAPEAGRGIPFSVRFDSRGEHGWQMKLLKLYASGSEEPLRIYVEADVD